MCPTKLAVLDMWSALLQKLQLEGNKIFLLLNLLLLFSTMHAWLLQMQLYCPSQAYCDLSIGLSHSLTASSLHVGVCKENPTT